MWPLRSRGGGGGASKSTLFAASLSPGDMFPLFEELVKSFQSINTYRYSGTVFETKEVAVKEVKDPKSLKVQHIFFSHVKENVH